MQLVEQPNGDFAVTMARQLFFSTYQLALYDGLTASTDATLAGVAAKAVKEVDYHRDHATQWVLRLGDGTEESHRRMQAGLDRLWPYADELFAPTSSSRRWWPTVSRSTPSTLRAGLGRATSTAVLAEATLTRPDGLRTPPGRRPARHPHRGARLPAGRDAAPAPRPPGSVLVSTMTATLSRRAGRRRGRCSTPRCRC